MTNHCIIVNLMGICSGANRDCEHYDGGWEDCNFHVDVRCCNSIAIHSSQIIDRRSKGRLDCLKAVPEP